MKSRSRYTYPQLCEGILADNKSLCSRKKLRNQRFCRQHLRKHLTDDWAWPMWLALAVWRVRIKAVWEQVSMEHARQWMQSWEPQEEDMQEFLSDLPQLLEGKRFRFRNGVVLC